MQAKNLVITPELEMVTMKLMHETFVYRDTQFARFHTNLIKGGGVMKKFKGFTLIAVLLASIIVPVASSQSASAAQTYSPRWVKNCIYVYDSIAKSHQQQCDQAYATAPGSWKKNCINVYYSDDH